MCIRCGAFVVVWCFEITVSTIACSHAHTHTHTHTHAHSHASASHCSCNRPFVFATHTPLSPPTNRQTGPTALGTSWWTTTAKCRRLVSCSSASSGALVASTAMSHCWRQHRRALPSLRSFSGRSSMRCPSQSSLQSWPVQYPTTAALSRGLRRRVAPASEATMCGGCGFRECESHPLPPLLIARTHAGPFATTRGRSRPLSRSLVRSSTLTPTQDGVRRQLQHNE
jgi:hypothetical protein